jgi:uncharacterized small protein (DUF1192 family)
LIVGIVFLISKRRNKKAKVAPANAGQLSVTDVEKLESRINELEKEKTALETTRDNNVKQYDELIKENGRLHELARTHNIRADLNDQALEALKTNYRWLYEIAERDKRHINSYVYIIFRKVNYRGLDEIEPYIEVIFDIINGSVYNIIIDKDIKDGAVYFNNTPLNSKQTEIDGSLHSISRNENERRFLVIKQWVSPELAKRIKNSQPDDKLFFNRLWLNVRDADSNSEVRPQRLSLPSEIAIETLDKLKTEIASLKSEIEEEKAKNAKPNIQGEIKEVYFDRSWSLFSEPVSGGNYDDYVFYINVYLANRGAETTIKEFKFVFKVDGKPYNGERMTVEDYYVLRPSVTAKKLIDLEDSNDVPLKYSRNGWLRFGFGVKPIQRVNDESGEELANRKLEIELDVIDKDETPHRLETVPPQLEWIKNELQSLNRVAHVRDM